MNSPDLDDVLGVRELPSVLPGEDAAVRLDTVLAGMNASDAWFERERWDRRVFTRDLNDNMLRARMRSMHEVVVLLCKVGARGIMDLREPGAPMRIESWHDFEPGESGRVHDFDHYEP